MEVFVPSWQEELEPRVNQAWEDTPPLLGCLLAVHYLCHCPPHGEAGATWTRLLGTLVVSFLSIGLQFTSTPSSGPSEPIRETAGFMSYLWQCLCGHSI